jgi:hypothetical protein
MPKTKISEYSTTNTDNSDIEGINIAEGCAPSGINNAIRELMVHLKEFQTGASGDAFTFAGGTLMSGTNTISGAAIISGNINSSGSANTFSGGVVHSGTNTFSSSVIISGNINSSGTNTFSGTGTFTSAQTFRAANAIRSEAASTQDAVVVAGRAGGTSSYAVTLTPTTLSANRTLTLPNATDTVAVLGTAQSFTATQTFKGLTDTVYTITDGAAFEIDPANGSIQIVTLGANRTPAATNFAAGQSVLLGIDDGTAYTVTWSTVNPTWVKSGGSGAAPTLATTGYTWVLLWKVSTTIYGAVVGSP